MIRFFLALCLLLALCAPWQHSMAEDAAASIKLRVVAASIHNTPWHSLWLNFSQQLRQRANNQIEPILYVNAQLGSEESTLSQLRRGRVQLGGFALQGASSVVPELGVLLAPYLFESLAEVDYAMDYHLHDIFKRLFAAQGLVFLRWAEVGWTSLYGTRPILEPAAVQGLKLRSSNALASQHFIRSVGADMVPLPFADLIPSLQTGLLDGGTSGLGIYALSGAAWEAPHVTLTRHSYDTGVILASRPWLESLPPQAQQAIDDSLPPAAQLRREVRAMIRDILDNPRRHGIRLYRPTPKQDAAWRAAVQGDHQRLIRAIGGEAQAVYQAILRARKERLKEQVKQEEQAGLP